MMSASRCAATAKARRRYMPEEYRFTGVSMNRSTPANETISSNRPAISFRLIPRMAPFRETFSRPVSSGWNPVPTSRSDVTRPRVRATPLVGSVILLMTFNRVLLPAPFRPITPRASPLATDRLTSARDQISSRTRRRPGLTALPRRNVAASRSVRPGRSSPRE
jgi:hypothetical protein